MSTLPRLVYTTLVVKQEGGWRLLRPRDGATSLQRFQTMRLNLTLYRRHTPSVGPTFSASCFKQSGLHTLQYFVSGYSLYILVLVFFIFHFQEHSKISQTSTNHLNHFIFIRIIRSRNSHNTSSKSWRTPTVLTFTKWQPLLLRN